MWKSNDSIQELKRSHQFTLQSSQTRTRPFKDWKALEIYPNPKRLTFHHTQTSSYIEDSDIIETADTIKDTNLPLKKNNRIIIKNGKIST